MALNFLEQLVNEWLQFNDYITKVNVRVGPREKGGYEGEIDVAAYHAGKQHLVHYECSMDALNWSNREKRFARKFELGRKYIPGLFRDFKVPKKIEQKALLVFASKKTHQTLGGGELVLSGEFLRRVLSEIKKKGMETRAVPETYTILRTLQFVTHHRNSIRDILQNP